MTPTNKLAIALRATAARLRGGAPYQWGHFGLCNCGHLAQTVTELSAAAIHRAALERAADWGDAAVEYCPASGYPIDHILGALLELGLDRDDIRALEELGDARVRARAAERLGAPGPIYFRRNHRDDLVRYLECWAELCEEALPPPERVEAARRAA